MKIDADKRYTAAFDEYPGVLKSLIAEYESPDVLELGGGRWPSFEIGEMPACIHSYTVNDISEAELAMAPPEYQKACFNVSGDASAFSGRYDVVFSKFLAEHVPDGFAMHRNVFKVLKPGGVAFHLIPTLYASPFVINRLIPERLGQALIDTIRPRDRQLAPKFPAPYSACFAGPRMRRLLSDIGYSDVRVREFYGHFYYDPVPVVRSIENGLSAMAAKNGWTWYSSYAFIIARK